MKERKGVSGCVGGGKKTGNVFIPDPDKWGDINP